MKKIVFILFMVILIPRASAQKVVPGYMGKRLIVGYGLKLSIAAVSPTVRNTAANGPNGLVGDAPEIFGNFNGFNTSHALNLDYIYHQRKAFCMTAQYVRTGIDYFYAGRMFYKGDLNKPAVLSSLGIGLGVKLFKRSNLAPYGPYVKWEGMMFLNKLSYKNNDYMQRDPNTNVEKKVSAGPGEVVTQIFGIGYGWGQQRIFGHKFVFDRGVRIMVIPAAYEALQGSGDYNTVPSGFENESVLRMFRHQFISFYAGIGFLAF